ASLDGVDDARARHKRNHAERVVALMNVSDPLAQTSFMDFPDHLSKFFARKLEQQLIDRVAKQEIGLRISKRHRWRGPGAVRPGFGNGRWDLSPSCAGGS